MNGLYWIVLTANVLTLICNVCTFVLLRRTDRLNRPEGLQ